MTPSLDGVRFGRWATLMFSRKAKGSYIWWCLCDCGTVKEVSQSNLLSGKSTSCGCYRAEHLHEYGFRHGATRGRRATPEYKAWCHIIDRCTNQKYPEFKYYGGRGITICERWRLDFMSFLVDVGSRPSKAHSIDRIDNNAGYFPGNCRWATKSEQTKNRRVTKFIEHNGLTLCLTDWARRIGIGESLLSWRLRMGWSVEQALTTAPYSGNRISRKQR